MFIILKLSRRVIDWKFDEEFSSMIPALTFRCGNLYDRYFSSLKFDLFNYDSIKMVQKG